MNNNKDNYDNINMDKHGLKNEENPYLVRDDLLLINGVLYIYIC